MVEKKTLVLAMEEAQQLSIKHPNMMYRVMGKHGKRAFVTGSDWVYRERVLEGWSCYCRVKNGRFV